MQIKVRNLQYQALDWAIAQIIEQPLTWHSAGYFVKRDEYGHDSDPWLASADWSIAGPLIEECGITLEAQDNNEGWVACAWDDAGDNPRGIACATDAITAALRCAAIICHGADASLNVPDAVAEASSTPRLLYARQEPELFHALTHKTVDHTAGQEEPCTMIQTSALQARALDWACAKCLEPHLTVEDFIASEHLGAGNYLDWELAGPIIEQARIGIEYLDKSWSAGHRAGSDQNNRYSQASASNPTEAAIQCFVASQMGEQVSVPSVLLAPRARWAPPPAITTPQRLRG